MTGAFPLSLTSPAVIWSNVPGAVLASVMSPEVTSSRIAMSPLGPLADEVDPPGRYVMSPLPRSTISSMNESVASEEIPSVYPEPTFML